MKKSISMITIFIFLTLSHLNAKTSDRKNLDSLMCLQIEGKILFDDKRDDIPCVIELISIGDGVDSTILKPGKSGFKLMLKKDTYYAIRISKKGYITKLISINTTLAESVDQIFRFAFQTHLMKESLLERINRDILDFPVAIIYYDIKKDFFTYNKEYSAFVKSELRKPTEVFGNLRLAAQ